MDSQKPKEKMNVRTFMFIATMGYLVMSDLFYTYSIVSYIADIVVDFDMTDDKRKSGFYTGVIIGAFFVGLFLSSIGWVLFSDRFGRRKILIVNMIFLCLLTFLSIFTYNYIYLVFLRFMMGFLSGLLPVSKTAVGENDNIPVDCLPMAFSALNFGSCFASVIAPLVSGFFSRPTKQYPWIFEGGGYGMNVIYDILDTFPLLIPNLFGFITIFIGLLLLITYGYETNQKFIKIESEEETEESSEQGYSSSSSSEISTTTEEEEEEFETTTTKKKNRNLKNPLISILMYSVMNIGVLIFVRTLPVQFSMLPEHKGLGLTNYEIGIIGFIVGVSGCISTIIGPPFIRLMNPVWVMRTLPLFMIVLIPFYPELSYLGETQEIIKWVLIIILTIFRSFIITTLYTCIVMILSNSVGKERKGILQGIANSLGGLGKGVGPLLGNSMLSIGALVDVFPMDIHFTFFVSVVMFVTVSGLAFFIPTSLKVPVDHQNNWEEKKYENNGDRNE